jgi:CheY-like chemotaxis protein
VRVACLDGVRVLLVDDEEDVRELLTAVLERCGAEVATAASADEGLRRLAERRPHVILSDVAMPVVDGYDFIRSVRRLPPAEGGNLPAAALTGFARDEDGCRAREAGFDAHIAKPVEPAVLAAAVARLLRIAPQPVAAGSAG